MFTGGSIIAALYSVPYTILGYAIGQAAIVLISEASVSVKMKATNVRLFVTALSPSEKQLFEAYRLFFVYPIAAVSIAQFLKFSRIFGLVWLAVALWYGYYVLFPVIPAYYILARWAIVHLSPITHAEAEAQAGDRIAQGRVAQLQAIRKRADAFALKLPFQAYRDRREQHGNNMAAKS
jgi:hypothetical protein